MTGAARSPGGSVQRGKSTSFYDGQGRFSGSSVRHGNSTSYYDKNGSYNGSTINTGVAAMRRLFIVAALSRSWLAGRAGPSGRKLHSRSSSKEILRRR
jgi:hypothetical protein